LGVKSDGRRVFFVTFVFFLMGIVPNNHQNSYNNETIIIDCVGLGGAVADGVTTFDIFTPRGSFDAQCRLMQ